MADRVRVTADGLERAAVLIWGSVQAMGPDWADEELAQLEAVAQQLNDEAARRRRRMLERARRGGPVRAGGVA